MRKFKARSRASDTILLSGWLFADLLLALAVIFLVSNTSTITPTPPPPIAQATPTPTPTPTATPAPRKGLERKFVGKPFTLNTEGLLTNNTDAQQDLKSQIRNWDVLQGKKVGFVIILAGASNENNIPRAYKVDEKIKSVLQDLGKSWMPFADTEYYDPLYSLGTNNNTVKIDVFLFSE